MAAPQINFITVREDSLLLSCDPGPCGSCNTVHAFFICREGKTQCVECDKKERELKSSGVEGQRFESADPESGSGEGTSSPSAPGAKGATA
jgi:hypothetical protein